MRLAEEMNMPPREIEIDAAKDVLDEAAALAKRDQPVPRTIIGLMLETAERVRTTQEDRR